MALTKRKTKASLSARQSKARKPVRERVLDAAFSAFTEKGYSRTSTLEIATRAKVSKRALYAVCTDKPALLREAVIARAERMRQVLALPPAKDGEALAQTLTAFGAATLHNICEAPVQAVYRLAIAEANRNPKIIRALEDGRKAHRAALRKMLVQAQRDRLLKPEDPDAMASDFLALLWSGLLIGLLLRTAVAPSAQAVMRQARNAAAKFLVLYSVK